MLFMLTPVFRPTLLDCTPGGVMRVASARARVSCATGTALGSGVSLVSGVAAIGGRCFSGCKLIEETAFLRDEICAEVSEAGWRGVWGPSFLNGR